MPERSVRARPLANLTLLLGDEAPEYRARQFQRAAWHIERSFAALLTSEGRYVLDGSPQLYLVLGERPKKPQLSTNTRLGVTQVYTGRFDCQRFLALSPVQQDQLLTDLIEATLLRVAKQAKAETALIRQAATQLREASYVGTCPIPALRLPHPQRNWTAQVGVQYERECQQRFFVRIEDKTGAIVTVAWIPAEALRSGNRLQNVFELKRSHMKWQRKKFSLRNQQNRSLISIDCDSSDAGSSEPPLTSALPTERSPTASPRRARPAATPRRAEKPDACQKLGLRFLEHLVKGEEQAALALLSKQGRKRTPPKRFRQQVQNYFDALAGMGASWKVVKKHLYVNVERDPLLVAAQIERLPASLRRNSIVAALEAGAELISREPLDLLVEDQGGEIALLML